MDILEMGGWFAGMFLFIFLSYKMPGNSFGWVLVVLAFAYICYCDNSFIRKYMLKKLPKQSSLRKKIMKRRVGDYRSQVYKALSFFCVWMNFWFVPMRFLTVIGCIILSVLSTVRYLKHQDTVKYGTLEDKNLSPTMLPFLAKGTEYKSKKSIIFTFLLSVLVFTFGVICAVNTDFDFSEPQEYRVKILDKWSSSGRSRSYYVDVTPWGGRGEEETIEISYPEYRDAEIGETAYIYEKEGFLKMEWYYIEIK